MYEQEVMRKISEHATNTTEAMRARLHEEAAKIARSLQSLELNKAERIRQYIQVLLEAQRSGHDVHKEIDEALKQYKSELGI